MRFAGTGVTQVRRRVPWRELEREHPALARFGRERIDRHVTYLATLRRDGGPRLHPINPRIVRGELIVFMEPDSPKVADLRRDPRCALHSLVTEVSGEEEGEFAVRGRAHESRDRRLRAAAKPRLERLVLFTFSIEWVLSTIYDEDGNAVRQRWNASA
jgi:hypothetical protein